jgi:uncharacterized repeat protein (TIGR01451 family)
VKSDTVATQVRLGKLKIEVQPDHTAQYTGQKLTYSITVTNEGDAKVEQSQVTAALGEAALAARAEPAFTSSNTWKLPALDPGKKSDPIKITVRSNTAGKLESSFTASFDCEGKSMEDKDTVSTEIKPLNLAVAVLPSESQVEQGDTFTCSLQVSNTGGSPDGELNLSVKLPEFAAYERMEGETEATYNAKTRTVRLATMKQIDPGTLRLRLRVRAEKTGKGPFVAELSSKMLSGAKVSFESETVTSVAPAKPEPSPSDKESSKPKDKAIDKEKPKAAEKPETDKAKGPVEAPSPKS